MLKILLEVYQALFKVNKSFLRLRFVFLRSHLGPSTQLFDRLSTIAG